MTRATWAMLVGGDRRMAEEFCKPDSHMPAESFRLVGDVDNEELFLINDGR
jgi:hypothetical protein